MSITEKYSYTKVYQIHRDLLLLRSEWDAEARQISKFLLPGRGIYQDYNKPRKRKLTTEGVINTMAEDALTVLASGLHGKLTSPAMPWFRADWEDSRLAQIPELKQWLEIAINTVHTKLQDSNFYSIMNSYYTEFFGFGNACFFVGEGDGAGDPPFYFEMLTFGEYCISLGRDGKPCVFTRNIFLSQRQLYKRYPKTCSEEVKKRVKSNQSGIDVVDTVLIEYISKDKYMDKQYVRIVYESHSIGAGNRNTGSSKTKKPLEVTGFYEWPYMFSRGHVIGSDPYGIGPGARALSDIKRLQEMEKAFLMATHKDIDPALNAPSRMRGKLNSLPGGRNYYANPNEVVTKLYDVNFNYQGVTAAIERVEERIQRNFYNDVFLTASRDPNASPLKAAQVYAQEQEKTFRLGPAVDNLLEGTFEPTIRRCFNICKRAGLFPELDPALEEIAGDFVIDVISPMAVAQKLVKSQGTDSFMGFVAQAAQFDPQVMDNVNPDIAVRQRADIEGVDIGVLRSDEEVQKIRAERLKAQKQQQEQEQGMAASQLQGQQATEAANNRKTIAETGQILSDTQSGAIEAGLQ